jgi:ketosteroid isomerase-like protein
MAEHDFLERLCTATNAHDIDGVVDLFHDDYVSTMPVHPSRSFVGREQVRRNWTQIFAGVPDIEVEVLQWTADGPKVWSEWEMRGTRTDGAEHLMRGVMIFTVADGRASALRFYMEPVDREHLDTDESVQQLLSRP